MRILGLKAAHVSFLPLLTLKTENELKKSYGDTFDKVLDFYEQKSHFLETFDTNAKTGLKDKKTNP